MTRPDLPYTSRAKRVLELTLEEAARSKAAFADTEHLLVALCVEGMGIAASAGLMARQDGAGMLLHYLERPINYLRRRSR